MLFDLQGKRRRVVQATYLMLAVLMGGGLVLFGIGGDVSGGLFDAFSDNNGGNGNKIVEERIERNEERVKENPKAAAPHRELVRDYYQLAVGQANDQGVYPAEAQDEFRKAAEHWNQYVALVKGEPDPSLARVALQIFDPTALNRPQQAVKAATIIARDSNNATGYVQLVTYALLAGDKRTEDLATTKALDLTPKKQRKKVQEQIDQLKAQMIAQQLQEEGKLDIEPDGAAGDAKGSKSDAKEPAKGGK